MKKKTLIATIVVLVILGLGILILSTVTISSSRVKDLVVKQAEKALKRKVEIGDLRVNLLRGIKVKRIMIGNTRGFAEEPFLEGDSFVLNFSLLPLFKKQIVISKITFLSPRILIERNQKGIWNFADLIKTSPGPGEGQNGGPGKALTLLLSQVSVSKGEITLRDRMFSSENKEMKLKAVDLRLSGFSPSSSTKLKISAQVQGGSLELSGEGDIFKKEGDFRLRLKNFDLARMGPAYQALIPAGPPRGARGVLDLDLEGRIEEGRILCSSGRLYLKGFGSGKIKNLGSNIIYKIEANLEERSLDIKEAKGNLDDVTFLLRGGLRELGKTPVLDLKLRAQVPLREVNRILEGESPDKSRILEGLGELEMEVRGDLKNPKVKGGFDIAKLKVGKMEVNDFQTDFLLVKKNLEFTTKANSYGGNLNSSGSLVLSGGPLTYNIEGTLKDFDLNEYVTAVTPWEDMVYGTLESKFSFSGQRGEDTKEDIEGKIVVKVGEGKLSSSALQKQLAEFLNIPLLEDIKHNGLTGNFLISEGIIRTSDFQIDGIDTDFLIRGTLSFEGEIDCTIVGIFPGDYANKISEDERIASLFRNKEGKTEVPVKVEGNLKSPPFRFKLDMDRVKRRAKERLKEEVRREFEEKFEEKVKDWLAPRFKSFN